MTELFPRVGLLRRGYDQEQVDEFFTAIRVAYERPVMDPNGLTAPELRRAAFDLVSRGYKTEDVDGALDRLEEAFSGRMREQFLRTYGRDAWNTQLAERAQVLYERLRRPKGNRFKKPRGIGRGYKARDVDALLDRITAFFDKGEELTAKEIRVAMFPRRAKWRSYDESQVDAYLARAVDIFLGVQ
jgi:DivIVA domain-containing protein